MTTINQKHQILESLDSLNQAQADDVLAYIKGLMYTSRNDARYKKLKHEAMKEISQALGKAES